MQAIRSIIRDLSQYVFSRRKAAKDMQDGFAEQAALESVINAYRRGDYDTALAFAEGLKQDGHKTAMYCFFQGILLQQLEQFDQSERWLRESVALATDEERRAVSLSTLGQVLVEQHRYDEAMQCFEKSLECAPRRGAAYRDQAELWLRRETRPLEALRCARLAVEKERIGEGPSLEAKNLNLSEDLATLAWAVAEASRDESEVDRLVHEAVPLVGSGTVSSAAQVHYHAGRAYAALGKAAKSEFHFGEAARMDPNGHWGRAAEKRLIG